MCYKKTLYTHTHTHWYRLDSRLNGCWSIKRWKLNSKFKPVCSVFISACGQFSKLYNIHHLLYIKLPELYVLHVVESTNRPSFGQSKFMIFWVIHTIICLVCGLIVDLMEFCSTCTQNTSLSFKIKKNLLNTKSGKHFLTKTKKRPKMVGFSWWRSLFPRWWATFKGLVNF